MPRPAIWVDVRIGRLRESEMRAAALLFWRGSIDRRADKWMPELHRFSDSQQTTRVGCGGLDPELPRCAPDEHRVADRLGGANQQQQPGVVGKHVDSALKTLLKPDRQRVARELQQPKAARELRPRQAPRQFQQRQGVAPGLSNDPILDTLIEGGENGFVEERTRVLVREPDHLELR